MQRRFARTSPSEVWPAEPPPAAPQGMRLASCSLFGPGLCERIEDSFGLQLGRFTQISNCKIELALSLIHAKRGRCNSRSLRRRSDGTVEIAPPLFASISMAA